MSLFAELQRRNVIRMAGLYLVGAWLITQVAGTVLPMFGAPDWLPRSIVILLALGSLPALIFAWVFELTPQGFKRDADVPLEHSIAPQTARRMDRMIIAVLLLALTYFGFDKFVLAPRRAAAMVATATASAATKPAAPAIPSVNRKSIAVLPFTDLSPDHDQEYFSDGMAEEILNALAQVKDLKVAGRTSSFHFKGKNDDLRAVGRALGVAHILEGSVRKQGDKVRITAQLIQTADGFHVWSESYDGDLKDVFQLQENIARSITDKLQVILQGDQTQRLVSVPTRNTEAYSLYLQATQTFNRRDGARFPEAISQLKEALRLDPRFARAHSRMAALQAVAANYDPRSTESAAAATEEHARKAIALDAGLAEPHAALGALYTRQRRYVEAFATLEQALALDPNDVTAKFWFATALCITGYLKRCDDVLDQVLELDPMLPNALSWRGREYIRTGDMDKAASMIKRSADAGLAHAGLGLSLLAETRGDLPGAEAYLRQGFAPFMSDFPPGSQRPLAHGVFGDAKARATAVAIVDRYLAGKPEPVSAIAIYVLLRTGAPQRGLAVAAEGPTTNDSIFQTPLWDNTSRRVRTLPEFSEFVRRMGLAGLWDKLGPPDLCRKNDKGVYVCR